MLHKGGWFYSGEPARSTEELFQVYRTVRNDGGNLLLDVGPNQQGRIEDQYVDALLNLKEKIEPFEQALAKGKP
jgi:alpha-L-fucosidase